MVFLTNHILEKCDIYDYNVFRVDYKQSLFAGSDITPVRAETRAEDT